MADDDTTEQPPQTPETGEAKGDAGQTAERIKETGGQPEIPPEVKRALSKANKEAESLRHKLKEFEDRDKTEAQKLTERAQAAEQEAASAKGQLLRYQVASEKQLPTGFAARLQGSTKEELEADADALLAALGTQQQRSTPNYDGGVRQQAQAPTDMNALIRQKAGLG